MACQYANLEDIEQFQKDVQLRVFNSTSLLETEMVVQQTQNHIIHLNRGGVIVKSKLGPIQFGLPPETVKDSLNINCEVPSYYIIPTQRFDKKFGISVAEFEFPAYYNFFVKNRKINLICSAEAEQTIRTVFQETLLGPIDHSYLAQDFHPSYPKEAYPDFKKELSIFSKNPKNPQEPLTIDTLLTFIIFNEQNIAQINEWLFIQQDNGHFMIFQDQQLLAKIQDIVVFPDEYKKYSEHIQCGSLTLINQLLPNEVPENQKEMKQQQVIVWSKDSAKTYKVSELSNCKANYSLNTPDLGVTVLGCSHGFDPKGSTSGYIFWVNGRGIMVDPPPFASFQMDKMGIPAMLISAIIISHCHADHDAGAFHKILYDTRVEIITTKTIMLSFLRKYSAISNMSVNQLKEMFIFRPAIIGTVLNIYGAKFRFFYALHTIPSIGFEVQVAGKSIYFSGDTFYEPKQLNNLKNQGYISPQRCDQLLNVNFDCDIILHEAGVPPIHTPQSVFQQLDQSVKDRIYLVHVAERDVEKGLKAAKTGIDNTLILLPYQSQDKFPAIQKLDLICRIDLFQSLSLQNIRWLLDAMTFSNFKQGQIITKEGEPGDRFYIIESGIARVYSTKEGNQFERYYQKQDYFGESALIEENGLRKATVEAFTELNVLSLEKHDFWFIFGNGFDGQGPVLEQLTNLSNARKCKAIQTLFKNSVFFEFSPSQKVAIEMIVQERLVTEGEILWSVGDEAKFAFIIRKGCCKFINCEESETLYLVGGAFVGEVGCMLDNKGLTTSVVSVKDSELFIIQREGLLQFLKMHPGLLIVFRDYKYFE